MMNVIKSTGQKEPFNKTKFCTSLKRSGAPGELANAVCGRVQEKVTAGISTSKLYREALRYLVKENSEVAARYSLYRGIAALGPAGYVFEQYIEVVLQAHGFQTMRDVYIEGACIRHEIDVVAVKDNVHYLLELKYHNQSGIKTHVPVVMYAYARLDDIARSENRKEKNKHQHVMWLITNTRFTDTAIQYADCKQIRVSGWNHPKEGNLEDLIVSKKLYPVTVLPSINQELLAQLVKRKVILAQDLATYPLADLKKLGASDALAQKVIQEVTGLFKS